MPPLTARLKALTDTPVIAVNRIPDPATAEAILAGAQADLIGLARPLLADPDWPNKARQGRRITPCIACNQACLDHTFQVRLAFLSLGDRPLRAFDDRGDAWPPARWMIARGWPPPTPELRAELDPFADLTHSAASQAPDRGHA